MMLKQYPVAAQDLPSNLAHSPADSRAVGLSESDLAHGGLARLVELRDTHTHLDHRLHVSEGTLEFLLNDLE